MLALVDSTGTPGPAVARSAAEVSTDGLLQAITTLARWPDTAETAVGLSRVVAARERGSGQPESCSPGLNGIARRLAFRGHLSEALCWLGEDRQRLFAELALLGGVPVDSARAEFGRWLRAGASNRTFALPWWAAQADSASIRGLAMRADSIVTSPATAADNRERAGYDVAAAAAYMALLRGDTADALHRFDTLPDTLCFDCFQLDRLTHARLLTATSRLDAAMELTGRWRGNPLYPTEVLAWLEHARAAERAGKRNEALAAYRFVSDAWARADSVLQPLLEESRAGQRRLAGLAAGR